MKKEIRVLLIEDNIYYADLLSFYLNEDKDFTWKIKHAAKLKEALNYLNLDHYDVIVSDFSLPGNPEGPVEAIREKHPDIPLLIISGFDRKTLAELIRGHELVDYMCKINIYPASFKETILKTMAAKEKSVSKI